MILVQDVKIKKFDGDYVEALDTLDDELFNISPYEFPYKVEENKKVRTELIEGQKFFINIHGQRHDIICGWTNSVYDALVLPLKILEDLPIDIGKYNDLKEKVKKLEEDKKKLINDYNQLRKKKIEYEDESERLRNNLEVVRNELQKYKKMSFWKRFKFLFGGING